MKTIFLVGEGKTDIGTAGQAAVLPEEAREGVVQVLVRALPRGKAIEELWGKINDPASHHPRSVCTRALRQLDMADDLSSKAAVVEECDVAQLERACPRGFGQFARALRRAFGSTAAD